MGDVLREAKLILRPDTTSASTRRSRVRGRLKEVGAANHCMTALEQLASGRIAREILNAQPKVRHGIPGSALNEASLAAGLTR